MARTNDPNSATTEFFINVVNNDFLNYQSSADPGYAVFGRVIYGLDTAVEAIRNVAVQSNGAGENSLPRQPPVIHWMVRMK